jgi:biopolymer transport protein ExbB
MKTFSFSLLATLASLTTVRAQAPAETATNTVENATAMGLSLLELLGKGGPVMWLLGGAAFFATVLVFILIFTVRRGAFVTTRYLGVAETLLRKRDLLGLLAVSNRHSEASAHVMRRVLDFESNHPDASNAEIREIAQAEGSRYATSMNQRVALLADIATLAPMLGLLGTVIGIIRSFGVLSQNAPQSSSLVLAGGVAEALVTTGAGLMLGILAAAFYAIFRGRAQRIIVDFESSVAFLTGILTTARAKGRAKSSTASRFDEEI